MPAADVPPPPLQLGANWILPVSQHKVSVFLGKNWQCCLGKRVNSERNTIWGGGAQIGSPSTILTGASLATSCRRGHNDTLQSHFVGTGPLAFCCVAKSGTALPSRDFLGYDSLSDTVLPSFLCAPQTPPHLYILPTSMPPSQNHSLHSADGSSKVFRNGAILSHQYTASEPRRPRDLALHRHENLLSGSGRYITEAWMGDVCLRYTQNISVQC
jgi:hypothetical protein